MFNRVSADGYFATTDGKLDWVVPDPELDKAAVSSMPESDTMLFGRRTYQMFEQFWPHALDDSDTAADPHAEGRRSPDIRAMAEWINNANKLVFSKTLKKVTWKNSRLLSQLDPREIESLKQQPGKDILVFGSGSVVSELTEHGLIDEYLFVVAPVLLGGGKQLLRDVSTRSKLDLLEAKAFPSGNVRLRYARAGLGD
jgi:dihydrofolate reductase